MNLGGIKIVHFSPGRVRLRIERVKDSPELAHEIHEQLMEVPAIKKVEVKGLTGSVLVVYDRRAIKTPESFGALCTALSKLYPTVSLSEV